MDSDQEGEEAVNEQDLTSLAGLSASLAYHKNLPSEELGAAFVSLFESAGHSFDERDLIRTGGAWLQSSLLMHVMLAESQAAQTAGFVDVVNALAAQCYLPDDLIAAQGCFDLVRLVQSGLVPSGHALSFADALFSLSTGGVERALRDIGIRVVSTLVTDSELNADLKKFLQLISRKGRTKMSKALLEGIHAVVVKGSTVQRKAAVTLAASLVGRWMPTPVLAILFTNAQSDTADSNRIIAVEAISFLFDEIAKDEKAAPSFAPSIQSVLCSVASRDSNAEVRCAAIDALGPRGSGAALLSHETARTLCDKLADRSVKTRTRAAMCLKSWETSHLSQVLTVADWQHVVKWGMAPLQVAKVTTAIQELVLQLLTGPEALHWLRSFHMFGPTHHETFLRTNAAQIFLPLLSACSTAAADGVDLGGSED